jgi:hypothetical protein
MWELSVCPVFSNLHIVLDTKEERILDSKEKTFFLCPRIFCHSCRWRCFPVFKEKFIGVLLEIELF